MAIIQCETCGSRYSDKDPSGCPICTPKIKAAQLSARQTDQAATHICKACGSKIRPRRITKGHIVLEIILWLVFFPAGIVYTMWRLCTRVTGCPICNSQDIIPRRSPAGAKIEQDINNKEFSKTQFS